MTATTEPQLQADVPCLRCGYNLRGLAADGRCPECGDAVLGAIDAYEAARRMRPPLDQADRRWLRSVAEGSVLSVVVFALMLVVAFGSAWMYEWKSPQRKWTLGLACTVWVLSWAATWKFTTREPDEINDERDARRFLRVTATIYLVMPFIWGITPRRASDAWLLPYFLAGLAGLAATASWFMRAGDLAGRAGARVLRVEARLLTWINLALFGCFVLLEPMHYSPIDSLSTLTRYVVPPIGPCDPFGDMGRWWRRDRTVGDAVLVAAPFMLWNASVVVRLMRLFVRAARRGGSSKIG